MKLQVLQENLTKALTTCSRFASSRVQLPVLANVLLKTQKNKLLVTATNLEISISISVGAKVSKEGEITVPARVITDLVSNLGTGQISLQAEKEHLRIFSDNFESSISGMNSSDFPSVPQSIPAKSFSLPGDDFSSSLEKVLYAVSNDETRPVLTGVLTILEKGEMTLVATDGFRLSRKKLKLKSVKDEGQLIIPKNALSEISRLAGSDEALSFSYKKADNQIIVGVGDSVLASRVIEGEFPDFEKIIPKDTKIKVDLDKEEVLRAVKLASVIARDAANVVKLEISEGEVKLEAESSATGTQKTKIDAKVKGLSGKKNLLIAFNYRFLEEFLGSVEGESVQMEFSESNSPALLLDHKDDTFLHIIMPVRLQS